MKTFECSAICTIQYRTHCCAIEGSLARGAGGRADRPPRLKGSARLGLHGAVAGQLGLLAFLPTRAPLANSADKDPSFS